jgi:hypothetical protein
MAKIRGLEISRRVSSTTRRPALQRPSRISRATWTANDRQQTVDTQQQPTNSRQTAKKKYLSIEEAKLSCIKPALALKLTVWKRP